MRQKRYLGLSHGTDNGAPCLHIRGGSRPILAALARIIASMSRRTLSGAWDPGRAIWFGLAFSQG